MRDILKIATVILLCFVISGCVHWLSNKDKVKTINVRFNANSDINRNIMNVASPIEITVYQLKDEQDFSSASYLQLSEEKIKGVIAKQNYIIWPGKETEHELILKPDTKMIGMVANYRILGKKQWRAVYKLNWLTFAINTRITKHGIEED